MIFPTPFKSLLAVHVLSALWILGGSASNVKAAEESVRIFLEEHCYACHGKDVSEGGLDLIKTAWALDDSEIRQRWIQIHDRIQKGEMPPDAGELLPEQRAEFVQQLGAAIYEADIKEVRELGRGPLRRLNRDEFEENLRDVLQLPDLDIRDMLPEDRVGNRFNKSAAMLDLSRVQLAGYLDAAEAALHRAIASGMEPPKLTTYRALATEMFQESETFGNREAMFYAKDSQLFSLDGKMLREIRTTGKHDPSLEMALFRSASWPYYGYPDGFLAKRSGAYQVRFSARAVLQLAGYVLKPAKHSLPMTFRARAPSGPDVSGDVRATGGLIDIQPEMSEYETVIRLRKGETFEYSLLGLPVPLARNVDNGPPTYRYPPFPEGGQPGVAFQWIEVSGPLAPPSWPPPSHQILFEELPIQASPRSHGLPIEVLSENPSEDAKRLLRRFADHAARQPVPEKALETYDQFILNRIEQQEPFAEAVLAGYQALLCSPQFLYLQEPANSEDDFAIASRLSHFLTNTRPDERLFEQAKSKRLRNPEILQREADRLIASPGFDRFVNSFTDYWLDLRHLRRDDPDIRLYPDYRFDDYLVESMEMETRAFFSALVRQNLPASALVSTNFALVNNRLAKHYGLPPVEGSAIRKVELTEESVYGGLLTQAAILKVTSNGTTTSPVVRGAWIMERLIGNPPPPPPAKVSAVEPDIRGATTIRELLALHTKSETCANCHAKFDPVGVALENFDILGGWRTDYRGLGMERQITGIDRAGHDFAYSIGEPVDPSGKLLGGRSFDNIRDLKTILAADDRQLARNLLSQLTIYSTGTPVRFSDRREIEQILDQCAANGYRVRDLIHALIVSPIFMGCTAGETRTAE